MTKTLVATALVLLATAPAPGQDDPLPEDDRRAIEREVYRLRRLLDLSDDQALRVGRILVDELLARRRRIGEILTPEQRERFESPRDAVTRRVGPPDLFGTNLVEHLRAEIDIDDDQAEVIDRIIGRARREMVLAFLENPTDSADSLSKVWREAEGRIEEVLPIDRRQKFRELAAGYRASNPLLEGVAGPPRPTVPLRRRDPAEFRRRRVDRALRALALSPEEEEILRPMIDAIEILRIEWPECDRARSDLERIAARDDASPEEMRQAMETLRRAVAVHEGLLAERRAELRELLSLEQEAALLALRVLE